MLLNGFTQCCINHHSEGQWKNPLDGSSRGYRNIHYWVELAQLLERGGFPEPCLAPDATEAQRWRRQYFDGLVRNDVLEFSRIQEVSAIRLFAQMLRSRVGSPLSLASIARDLAVSPATLKKYLDILEALYIVFVVRPYHDNIAQNSSIWLKLNYTIGGAFNTVF